MTFESNRVEYKERYTDGLPKEVVAFANSDGGHIVLGVLSDGTATGLEDPDGQMTAASNAVRDAIAPDVTMFVSYSHKDLDGKNLVDITVERGDARPYYLKRHGMTPKGVQVRDGASSVPASPERIRRLLHEDSGRPWETLRSPVQDMTFDYVGESFRQRGIVLDDTIERNLGIIGQDGLYTNLGLLLSDQCPAKIRCATFADEDGVIFADRADIKGSVVQQLDDALAYLRRGASLVSAFDGAVRVDHERRPAAALAEALANAVMHRDYAIDGDTQVSVFADRTEVLSHGALVEGQSLEEIFRGSSKFRNKRLSEVLMRLGYVEAFGTGVRRIRAAYKESASTPKFEDLSHTFLVTLPDFEPKEGTTDRYAKTEAPETRTGSEFMRKIMLGLFDEKEFIQRKDIEAALKVGQSQAAKILSALVTEGELVRVGAGRSTRYRLP